MSEQRNSIIVIGNTMAAMTAAIAAAKKGACVTIVSRQPLMRSPDVTRNEGVAAVLNAEQFDDSVDQQIRDVMSDASCVLSENQVRRIYTRAPMFVRFLARAGVLFNRTTEGHLEQIQDEGHTRPRTVRADDVTGQQVVRVLIEQIRFLTTHELIECKEYMVPLSVVVDEEGRCRGIVIMSRTNHACTVLKADAVVVASSDGEWVQFGDDNSSTRCTHQGLIVDDQYMTILRGLFAAGPSAAGYGNADTAAHLMSGVYAGEAAFGYVADLTTRADDLGTSLFERAGDREEKLNKELMNRSEGENPYIIADELTVLMEKCAAGAYDEEALNALATRAQNIKLPDQSSWWNDGLIFARDLQNRITLTLKGLERFSTG